MFNLVMGRGSVVGQAMVRSADVSTISFTGSVATGRRLVADATARIAKVQAEMSGKNPLIILDDADLDTAVMCAVPALFIDATAEMRIAREEIFGPVACVLVADSYEHAVALANDSEFGLSAGICTTSLRKAMHFRRHMRAGMVMVNVPTAGVDYHVQFGGTKGSSYGAREQGSYAADFYTTMKIAYTLA